MSGGGGAGCSGHQCPPRDLGGRPGLSRLVRSVLSAGVGGVAGAPCVALAVPTTTTLSSLAPKQSVCQRSIPQADEGVTKGEERECVWKKCKPQTRGPPARAHHCPGRNAQDALLCSPLHAGKELRRAARVCACSWLCPPCLAPSLTQRIPPPFTGRRMAAGVWEPLGPRSWVASPLAGLGSDRQSPRDSSTRACSRPAGSRADVDAGANGPSSTSFLHSRCSW